MKEHAKTEEGEGGRDKEGCKRDRDRVGQRKRDPKHLCSCLSHPHDHIAIGRQLTRPNAHLQGACGIVTPKLAHGGTLCSVFQNGSNKNMKNACT